MAVGDSYSGKEGSRQGAPEFETLVDLHYESLFRFAMSLAHAESDAADLVQDTFVTWAEKGHQLNDPGKAKSWLFTTLHRRFLERQRRITRFPEVDIDSMTESLAEADPEVVNRLDGGELVRLLERVDPQFKGAVALFYLEDCSYAEIGEILEIPLGTVKSRLARGLVQLRALVLRGPTGTPNREGAP